MDREKLIKNIERQMSEPTNEYVLLFWFSEAEYVLELLKEQDPVEPELEGGGSSWWYVCGECHGTIYDSDNFCKHCGRRIKHEKKAE